MTTNPTPPVAAAGDLTSRILRGADRFRATAGPTTSRIRRSVTGRIEPSGLVNQPIQVVCFSCRQTFVAIAREGDAVQVPCIHCGKVQAIALERLTAGSGTMTSGITRRNRPQPTPCQCRP